MWGLVQRGIEATSLIRAAETGAEKLGVEADLSRILKYGLQMSEDKLEEDFFTDDED